MKNRIRKISIGMIAGFSLMSCAVLVNAQSTNESAWGVSKDVQKISNKQLFEDESLKRSHINAVVISPTWNQSKGVASIGKSADIGKGNIVSTGVPDWTISKGVQRIQYKKKASESNSPLRKQEEEITRNGEQ